MVTAITAGAHTTTTGTLARTTTGIATGNATMNEFGRGDPHRPLLRRGDCGRQRPQPSDDQHDRQPKYLLSDHISAKQSQRFRRAPAFLRPFQYGNEAEAVLSR